MTPWPQKDFCFLCFVMACDMIFLFSLVWWSVSCDWKEYKTLVSLRLSAFGLSTFVCMLKYLLLPFLSNLYLRMGSCAHFVVVVVLGLRNPKGGSFGLPSVKAVVGRTVQHTGRWGILQPHFRTLLDFEQKGCTEGQWWAHFNPHGLNIHWYHQRCGQNIMDGMMLIKKMQREEKNGPAFGLIPPFLCKAHLSWVKAVVPWWTLYESAKVIIHGKTMERMCNIIIIVL